MYIAYTSALPFKDNPLRSQVPTWAFTLACTFGQFRYSRRSGPTRTPRMLTSPLLQRRGPDRLLLPVQAPSRKTSLLSKLTLAPTIRSYPATAFFTASMSRRRDTKTVISSANPETSAVRGPTKGDREGSDLPPHP